VVARVAPAPDRRFAQYHETGQLIDRVVHPARAERGAMAAFMPAGVRGRSVEHAIGGEERHPPPASPEVPSKPSGQAKPGQPNQSTPDWRTLPALPELLQPPAWHR